MPHPERAAEAVLGNRDGLALFEGLVEGAMAGVAGAGQRVTAVELHS
jgi:phosphoribosylformylglycinamidine (FGAM) synthase-like amidotransferase family enzyme